MAPLVTGWWYNRALHNMLDFGVIDGWICTILHRNTDVYVEKVQKAGKRQNTQNLDAITTLATRIAPLATTLARIEM
jgi:adenine/guanine phosphoribosyltransferase-like PRPP-binding protein